MAVKYLPKLYKRTSTGAIQGWEIGVDRQTIHTRFGQIDGKITATQDLVLRGKNLGRKNETTAAQQARDEAGAKWIKMKKKGYVENLTDAENGSTDALIKGGVLPMLAKVFQDHSSKIVSQHVFVQPKLDGGRVIAMIDDNYGVTLWSRTRKRILSLDHISEKLSEIAKRKKWRNKILDGEAYHHGLKDDFEKVMSAFRKDRTTKESRKLQYHVYDCVEDKDFHERFLPLADLVLLGGNVVQLVPTKRISPDPDLLSGLHEFYVGKGYEGVMVRLPNRGYEHKKTDQLLKLKEFKDDEFQIVDLKEGRGKLRGHCGAFVCETKNGKEFSVKMEGSLENLREYWKHRKKYIGKWITVQYQGFTKKGRPRFPVGLRFREDLDL